MKLRFALLVLVAGILVFFTFKRLKSVYQVRLNGTWALVSHTAITNGVKVVTDYTRGQQMIKIINDSHFAYLEHNLNTKKDSSNNFDAGGGSYTLKGDQYTEHTDFNADKNREARSFNFTVRIYNDTLIQTGTEKVGNERISRTIIEKYIKVK
jgi:hypothetical protein